MSCGFIMRCPAGCPRCSSASRPHGAAFREARHQADWLLDGGDRRIESGFDLYPAMGLTGRTRKEFASFQADPEWIEARRKSEENGPLFTSFSNTIMTPTSFSALR